MIRPMSPLTNPVTATLLKTATTPRTPYIKVIGHGKTTVTTDSPIHEGKVAKSKASTLNAASQKVDPLKTNKSNVPITPRVQFQNNY